MTTEQANQDREGWRTTYNAVLKMLELEGNWHWARWNCFLVANSLMFATLGVIGHAGAPLMATHVLSWAGLLVCVCWWHTALQGARFYDMRVEQARHVECMLGMTEYGALTDGKSRASDVRRSAWYLRWKASWTTGHVIPLLFMVVWGLLLVPGPQGPGEAATEWPTTTRTSSATAAKVPAEGADFLQVLREAEEIERKQRAQAQDAEFSEDEEGQGGRT